MKQKAAIKGAISPIMPAAHGRYGGNATTYATYFMYNEQPEEYAENAPIATGSYWQIDLWRKPGDSGKTDLDDLKTQVVAALSGIGFQGFTAQELYESDTKTDHIALRCNFIE